MRARIPYSREELAFVEARKELPRAEIHAEFVRAFARHDVLIDDIKGLCTRRGWTSRLPWTPEEDALMREQFPHISTARVVALLPGRTVCAVNNRANTLGLVKTEVYLASPDACRLRRGDNIGAAYRFQKGHTTHNKGKKMPEGWSPGRMRETQFVKGQVSSNWKPIGSTRISDGYEYTKISDERYVPYTVNWKPTHVVRWEAVHGPVPEGHVLKSRDGNRLNTDPDNWQLLSRSLLPRLSGGKAGRIGYDVAPAELKPTLMAVAQLEHAARQRKRAVNNAVEAKRA